jgi:hypothetical protein
MVINIPTFQDILYIPGVFEVLKFAWIQYFSFLIIFYVLLYRGFMGFVIKSKVFDSVEISSVNVNAIANQQTRF